MAKGALVPMMDLAPRSSHMFPTIHLPKGTITVHLPMRSGLAIESTATAVSVGWGI